MYVNVELVNTWKSRRRIQDICGQAHDRAITFLALLDTNDLFLQHYRYRSRKDIALIYISKLLDKLFRSIFTSIFIYSKGLIHATRGFPILRIMVDIIDHSFRRRAKSVSEFFSYISAYTFSVLHVFVITYRDLCIQW